MQPRLDSRYETMYPELTNLLPEDRTRVLRRDYFLRLCTVAALFASALVVIHTVLLLPAYVLLDQEVRTREVRLASISSALASSDEAVLEKRLTTLAEQAALLTTLGTVPSASNVFSDVLAVPHAGVALSGFSFTPSAGKAAGMLSVNGIARTREDLRQFQIALQNATFAASVDLPVSAYAKDTDINFVVTITLKAQ